MNDGLIKGEDGLMRCWWHGGDAAYIRYHDEEWGRPVRDDIRLFEKMSLEGFQAGLSWLTILRKRENFRKAFAGFDVKKIAKFTEKDTGHLLKNEGIIRHRGKIEAVINNAKLVPDIVKEHGSFAAYIWSFEPDKYRHCEEAERPTRKSKDCFAPLAITKTRKDDIPAQTDFSKALSKDLKKRGFKFIGPTTMYALMQAMGMVNDHLKGCYCHPIIQEERRNFKRPV